MNGIVFKWRLLYVNLCWLCNCIGTDVIDDLATGTFRVVIDHPPATSLLVNQTIQLHAQILTQDSELISGQAVVWVSSDPTVIAVNEQGIVTGIKAGQAEVSAGFQEAVSEFILLTVVNSASEIAQVSIITEPVPLSVGDTLQLMASALDLNGDPKEEIDFTWVSSDQNILTISATGLVTAIAQGTAEITASAEEIQSEPLLLTVGSTTRSGMFQSNGGYTAKGTVALSQNEAGHLILTTSEDFEADLALGTFLYLSNSQSGSETFINGLEIADISDNPEGQKSFDISSIDSEVRLTTYRYVIVLCKPARVSFGFAELK